MFKKSRRKTELTTDGTFCRIMIEGVEPETSFFQTFWSPETETGEAIQAVLNACPHLGITNPIVRELDYVQFDPSGVKAVDNDKNSNVFYAQGRTFFPTEKTFIPPCGIIESSQKGENDYESIKEGFCLTKTDDIYEVEAAVERDKLFSTFVELMNHLPSIVVFWIKLAADWENKGREEFWTNEDLNSSEAIATFLTARSPDTVENGHVALTAYSDVGQTNLSIDTHKTIKVLTKSKEVQQTMAGALRSLGFKKLSTLYSLEYGYYHWHYRPAGSKTRTNLIRALKKAGFTLWRSEVPDVAEPEPSEET